MLELQPECKYLSKQNRTIITSSSNSDILQLPKWRLDQVTTPGLHNALTKRKRIRSVALLGRYGKIIFLNGMRQGNE